MQLGSGPRSRAAAVCFSERTGSVWQKLMSLSDSFGEAANILLFHQTIKLLSVCAETCVNGRVHLGS